MDAGSITLIVALSGTFGGVVVAIVQGIFNRGATRLQQDGEKQVALNTNLLTGLDNQVTRLENRVNHLEGKVEALQQELLKSQSALLVAEREKNALLLERDRALQECAERSARLLELEAYIAKQELRIQELARELAAEREKREAMLERVQMGEVP